MSRDEFWNQSPYLARVYRKAYYHRKSEINQNMWIQGLYIYNALGVVMNNCFGGKGVKKLNYVEKPIEIFPPTPAEEQRKAEEERKKIIAAFNVWSKLIDKQGD